MLIPIVHGGHSSLKPYEFITAGSSENSSTLTFDDPVPANSLIFLVGASDGNSSIANPAGFTSLQNGSPNGVGYRICWKLTSSTETNITGLETGSGNSSVAWAAAAFTSTPGEPGEVDGAIRSGTSSNIASADLGATMDAESLLLYAVMLDDDVPTIPLTGAPTGMTLAVSQNSGQSSGNNATVGIYYEKFTTDGNGSNPSTFTTSGFNDAYSTYVSAWGNATAGAPPPPPPPPSPPPPSPPPPAPATCFLGGQLVLMADGEWKRIADIKVGDQVRGRWMVNTVRGIELPILGDRHLININDRCLNTPDHPQWTRNGWEVGNRNAYIERDYNKEFRLWDGDRSWLERYTPCLPGDMGQLIVGVTEMATPHGWERLHSLDVVRMSPYTQLYALALDECRTMYVDGYCFSGWADIHKFDYQARIGS